MGISRDSWHKRYKTGATRPVPHKKRKFELGRPAANTKVLLNHICKLFECHDLVVDCPKFCIIPLPL
uniref:Transposase n=1 Tax=Heterorhabditis bacteriophora TaxID=37862 RepID=A0A1I7WLQ7_HETBA